MTTSVETGRYFEDFRIGDMVVTSPRCVSASDVDGFAKITGDTLAGSGSFGAPIAHGMLGISIAIGLIEQTGVHHGTSIAMLEVVNWGFLQPIHVGQEVAARMTVTGKHPSADEGRGVLVRHLALVDGHGNVLQEGIVTLLVSTGAADSAPNDTTTSVAVSRPGSPV
jgi:acyl dehydratase